MSNLLWRLGEWFTGIPAAQLKCKHYAMDYKMKMIPEENGMDFYEVCLNCNREWHAKRK